MTLYFVISFLPLVPCGCVLSSLYLDYIPFKMFLVGISLYHTG